MRATLIETLEQAFEGHGLHADIFPIRQYVYTVYTQMHARRIPVEETYGVRGIRILVDGKMDCYQALGILHQCWRPVPERFIDYIATPKDKFYQSLHTAVFYEDGLPFDVQIRTHEMDYQANYGIVAYLRYNNEPHELDRRMDYLKQLIEPAEVEETPERFVQSVIENIDSDRIYVMTPKGDMLDLPRGSTPIDFAYHVHTEVGHRCRGARVNGKLVPLDYKLKTNDRVEIYTANRGGPSLEWLDERLDYVRTNRARNAIRTWFRKQRRERVISTGEKALDDALEQLGMHAGEHEGVRDTSEFATVNEMLEAIGKGSVSATQVITEELERREREAPRNGSIQAYPTTGARGYSVKLARCCKPEPEQDIVGYVTREGKVSVHRTDCRLVAERGNIADRMIPVEWGARSAQATLRIPIEFLTEDRPGMLADIGEVLATHNVNLTQGHITTDSGLATLHVTVDVDSYDTLSRVLTIIKSIEGVKEARRSTL
jgi:GTP pyrophosphokinase